MSKTELLRLEPGFATSALAIAELARGLHTAIDEFELERRQRHLLRIEEAIEVFPFDLRCAHAHGVVAAAVERIGRKARGSRTVDLMIAATALAWELPLYTLNLKDLRGLEGLIEIVDAGH